MNKKEQLNAIKNHLKITKNTEFAKFLGIKPTTLSMWFKRETFDIELLFKKCEFLNPSWLLTGKGPMLKDQDQSVIKIDPFLAVKQKGSIPLVTLTAVAGFGNAEFTIKEEDVKDYYVVPKFKHNRVDFMIEVRGNSMYPKYNSGDVIACTILRESTFIQWNKPHLVVTNEQGLLVKRILESKNKGCFILKSDNKEYPPFEIDKSEINGIAIIIGVIRLE
jgi:phage repressor protein C with HTH and peptisase S24 domain